MKVIPSHFKVKGNITLKHISTKLDNTPSKKIIEKQLDKSRRDLANFQTKLYAHDKHAVLCCFQGMDTSGKDSLVREVFKDFNVRGVIQHSFKVPTDLERSHGYLWRHYIALPPKGHFGIFNRTHYENVLVTRVHPGYLMGENLPDFKGPEDATQEFWDMRFEQIRNFEKELVENGTIIFKFYMHLSKDEQKNRLLSRLKTPDKNWKFSAGDLKERKLWEDYMKYYEEAIEKTATNYAPWYVIPADDKPTARLIVSEILNKELASYSHITFPTLDQETLTNLESYIKELNEE